MENILEKINQAGLRLLETVSPEDTYKAIVTEAIQLSNAENGSIFLAKGELLERVYTSDQELHKTEIRKRGFAYRTFKTRKPTVISMDQIAKVHPNLKRMKLKSTIFIPLSHNKESIGVLTLNSLKREHFTDKEFEILKLFGAMSSLAIKKSQQYSETKKALEIRDMFISMAAHELRTPITSISGYIQLIHSKLGNKDSVESKWIRELYEENKRLTNLVKEILEVNRIKTGQIQFIWQECGVIEILSKAIQEVKKDHHDRTINFENKVKEGEDAIVGDESKLVQAFSNIIDNALKYSPQSTTVDLQLTTRAGLYSIAVKDQGRGIDKKDLDYIFEGHHKGEGGEEGLGIGLYFVDSIVRQHKGAIHVKSKLKKGTTFEVRLPRSKVT